MRQLDVLLDRFAGRKSIGQWHDETSLAYQGSIYHLLGGLSAEWSDLPQWHDQVEGVHRRFGVVAAAVFARASLLSMVTFKWRGLSDRRLYGSPGLELLERPDPSGFETKNTLLARAEQHVSYAGTAFFVRNNDELRLLDPRRTAVVAEIDLITSTKTPLEYLVYEGRAGTGDPVARIPARFVAQWSSLYLDPENRLLGSSWVESIIAEIDQDWKTTRYIQRFFDHGATPSVLVGVPKDFSQDQVEQFAELARTQYGGVDNAHRMMFVGAASDVQVVGSRISDLAVGELRGEIEARAAMASRIPAVILGVPTAAVTGGSALNAGNYSATRRTLADLFWTPTVQSLCRCLEKLVNRPTGSELWYDPTDALFMQEDRADEADIVSKKMSAVRVAIDAGFEPVSAVEHLAPEWAGMEHTGQMTVQVQPTVGGGGDEDDG